MSIIQDMERADEEYVTTLIGMVAKNMRERGWSHPDRYAQAKWAETGRVLVKEGIVAGTVDVYVKVRTIELVGRDVAYGEAK